MNPTRFLIILRRHLWHILLAALVCGGTTAFLVKDLPARYKATSQVIIDINASTSGTGAELSPFIIDKYIATQVDILSSQAVALRVVDEMRLAGEPGASAEGSQEQAQAKAASASRSSRGATPASSPLPRPRRIRSRRATLPTPGQCSTWRKRSTCG